LMNSQIHISKLGSQMLEKKLTRVSKVWTDGRYNSSELKMNSMRPGAYDFLKCPSRMGDQLFYRKESL
jgi:hypothetical protein